MNLYEFVQLEYYMLAIYITISIFMSVHPYAIVVQPRPVILKIPEKQLILEVTVTVCLRQFQWLCSEMKDLQRK